MRSYNNYKGHSHEHSHGHEIREEMKLLDNMLDPGKFSRPCEFGNNKERNRSYGQKLDSFNHIIDGLDKDRLTEEEMQILKKSLGRDKRNHDSHNSKKKLQILTNFRMKKNQKNTITII